MLAPVFERARNEGRLAFIPYIWAGDPSLATTMLLLRALSEAGADIIALGIPYGDVGPKHRRTTTLEAVLACVRLQRDEIAPVALVAYADAIYDYGVQRFARDAADAGCAAVMVPDVAARRAAALRKAFKAASLEMPMFVAAETPKSRARLIAKRSSGFVYVAVRTLEQLAHVAEVRAVTDLPLAVNFRMGREKDVARVVGHADAVVVDRALIEAYEGRSGERAASRARTTARSLIAAAKGLRPR